MGDAKYFSPDLHAFSASLNDLPFSPEFDSVNIVQLRSYDVVSNQYTRSNGH